MQRIENYIDGRFQSPASGAHLDNFEPATGRVYSHLSDSSDADVNAAVDAAVRAFPSWAATPAEARSRLMLRWADLIERDLEAFARAESIDTGKPIALARSLDIPRAIANLRFFATAILHTASQAHITDDRAINYTLRQPRGVAGCISPWNLPLYLFTWKFAPALATGNTIVAKPSEVTPMTAHLLAGLANEAGLPPGVFNVVHGLGPRVGAPLVAHPNVPAITFTGGTKTGAAIAAAAAPKFKKLSLELGGKNPNLVFADADFDHAVTTSVRAAFLNQGQICLCGSRIFVEASIYDRFLRAFIEKTRALRQGDPLDETTEQGAVVSAQHLRKIQDCVELARREGGRIELGGSVAPAPNARCTNGYFFQPTIITGLDAQCRTNQEEIFGPVVTVQPFTTEDDAVAFANATEYGLAATIFTSNVSRAHRVASRLQAGTVWINCWLLRDLRVPFGGTKQSGVGREGGEEALHFFTEPTNICIARQ